MAMIQHVPQHVQAVLLPEECFDLIATLKSAVREFEGVPESIGGIIAALETAYAKIGDLPNVNPLESPDEDGGTTVGV